MMRQSARWGLSENVVSESWIEGARSGLAPRHTIRR
ncbi:MAG: hypothetical protein RLZZ326_394 [Planctomycetota bacterium]